jgi:hypothetical protein
MQITLRDLSTQKELHFNSTLFPQMTNLRHKNLSNSNKLARLTLANNSLPLSGAGGSLIGVLSVS